MQMAQFKYANISIGVLTNVQSLQRCLHRMPSHDVKGSLGHRQIDSTLDRAHARVLESTS